MTNFKFFFALCFVLLAWPSHAQQEVDYIVALVNSEPITRNDVLTRQARLQAQWAAQGTTSPPNSEVFKRVLDQLVEERVIMQIGKDTGARVSDAQLADTLLDIARKNSMSSLAELQTKYEAEGGNWSAYREEIRGELLRQQVREREVDARVRVSEAEIDQAMQAQNLATNATPDINLAQILVALPDEPNPDVIAKALQKARQMAAQARTAGADFSKLAEQQSDAMDKTKGGIMALDGSDSRTLAPSIDLVGKI